MGKKRNLNDYTKMLLFLNFAIYMATNSIVAAVCSSSKIEPSKLEEKLSDSCKTRIDRIAMGAFKPGRYYGYYIRSYFSK